MVEVAEKPGTGEIQMALLCQANIISVQSDAINKKSRLKPT